MKKGFSLSEIIVSLAIIGVISTITLPLILSVGEDTNKYLYKKAFQLTETAISDLVSNTTIYPYGNFVNASNASFFCLNFASEFNTLGSVNCTGPSSITNPNFITSNGMVWTKLENTFASNVTITVDIDGPSKTGNKAHIDLMDIIITPSGKLSAPSGNETDYLMQ